MPIQRRLMWIFVLLMSTESVFAQYLPEFGLRGWFTRIHDLLVEPSLQFFIILIGLWIVAYCVIMYGMQRGGILAGANGGPLTYQGKILASTLAAFLPFFFIWLTRSQTAAVAVTVFITPMACGLGWILFVAVFLITFGIMRMLWTNAGQAQGQQPPPGGNP